MLCKNAKICYNFLMAYNCTLCPVNCGADRETQVGACGGGKLARVAKFGLHPYEEPCISCGAGSGTVFFSGCALRCVFCQNGEISRAAVGKEYGAAGLARIFRELEEAGAANINLVTAAHYVPQLIEAFGIYRPRIPVVYNTHAYEKPETLRALDRYIDVYLPDLKYCSPKISQRYTGKADYFEVAFPAVRFMAARKVSFEGERMVTGCIVRHLVLPLCTDDSIAVVRAFASLRSEAYFSLMGQYTPCGDIGNFPELQRRITPREYRKVLAAVRECGLERVFLQDIASANAAYVPDFSDKSDKLF